MLNNFTPGCVRYKTVCGIECKKAHWKTDGFGKFLAPPLLLFGFSVSFTATCRWTTWVLRDSRTTYKLTTVTVDSCQNARHINLKWAFLCVCVNTYIRLPTTCRERSLFLWLLTATTGLWWWTQASSFFGLVQSANGGKNVNPISARICHYIYNINNC